MVWMNKLKSNIIMQNATKLESVINLNVNTQLLETNMNL